MVILETNGVTHNLKKYIKPRHAAPWPTGYLCPAPLGKIDGASPPSQTDCCTVPGYNTVDVGLCNFF